MVTIDLTMPNMEGTVAIPLIAEICPDARILVVSALADKATAIGALASGAQGFLCKPFTDDELTSSPSTNWIKTKVSPHHEQKL